MKLSKISWLVIGIGIFVVATVVIYFMYQSNVNERKAAEEAKAEVEEVQLPELEGKKQILEDEMAQKEAEIAQWQAEIDQLVEQLNQVEQEVGQAQQGFPVSIDGIDYSETLFAFADASGIYITGLDSSEPSHQDMNENTYTVTLFNLRMQGEIADMLEFLKMIVDDEEFKTAVIEPVSLSVPAILTNEQIDEIRNALEKEMMADALQEITTQQILDFVLEAIAEVTGVDIETRVAEDMAETIKNRMQESLAGDYNELLSGELADVIIEYITNSVVGEVIKPLAEDIAALITPMEEVQISTMMKDWSPGANWTIYNGQFHGKGGGGIAERTLTQNIDIDLSANVGQEVTISWEQGESGHMESGDILYFAISNDGGITWSDNEEAFSDDSQYAPFSYIVPQSYLTNQFRIRFYWAADDTSEYCLVENIQISIQEGGDGFLYNALVELLGEDIAALLGEQIANSMPGDINSILTEFIAMLVEAKMESSVSGPIDAAIEGLVEQQVEIAQMPEVDIELAVYAYQEEGE